MTTRPLKILVIRLSAWGDVILTLGAVRRLLAVSGNEVHGLTKSKFAPVYREADGLCVHEIPDGASLSELMKVVRALRAENYDYVLDLHSNLRSRLICALLGRITFRIRKPRMRELVLFSLRKVGRSLCSSSYHRARSALQLVAGEGSSTLPPRKPQEGHWVAFCSDTAWATKQWPEDRFLELARRLKASKPELKILWLGLNRSTALDGHVCDEDGRGVSSMRELRSRLARCQLLFCNDTGMMHLAEDVGVPVAAVFGPTTAELGFGPRLPQSRIVERPLWCRPCSKNGSKCHRLTDRQACLKAVTIEDALTAITPMLTNPRHHDSLTVT